MNKLYLSSMLSLLLLITTQVAQARDKGLYVGASIGQSDVSISASNDVNVGSFKGKDTAYKILAGLRPLDWLGVELNYVDMGKPDSAALAAKPTGVSGFAVGFWDIGPVDLFAKAGAINWNAKVTSDGIRRSTHDGTDLAYGVGVQVGILALTLRAEYERYEVDKGANLLSAGVVFTFL